MSERMTDERFNSLVTQSELFPSWFDPIVLELLRAMKAERSEVARLKDAIREHRDSFSKDMDEHDWTTEDETLWELIGD